MPADATNPQNRAELPAHLSVLERGWLSSNNTLLHGLPGEPAVLVDSGHCVHAAQTEALVRHALASAGGPGATLGRIVNTHLHSDHCGGNARLREAFGARIWVPPGHSDAARAWDVDALGYRPTGQLCVRYPVDATLQSGQSLQVGGLDWQVMAAPGHDPHAVVLFEPRHGVLLSADALWENGFGVVFPELDGASGFDEVEAVLDLIAGLPVRHVVPGHGAPFGDVDAALARARSRLASHRADPSRHARHAGKVLLKYHLMELGSQPLDALRCWGRETPMIATTQRAAGVGGTVEDWFAGLLADLLGSGALRRDGEVVFDA
ncbi:MBL fold metallo-hydrolase [Leptothrix discophora]|uniref:MBL fold metallo-hydrolase n=1 Tax=Leptothrix discophora TaxID=89 RepID=A0ABT9FZY9_LEPDI|nr:MBL fold metallo-hydrolase [Leptothrix discophora]MDP4299797.1 MBL fold metallo-hydrolase [Leptothrix discophora]